MRKLFLFILLTALLSFPLLAQDDGEDDISPELTLKLDTLEAETEVMRGLEEIENVVRDFPTRDELLIYLNDVFEEELTPDYITGEMAFYTAFDFVEPDLDLYKTMLKLYGDQVAGFYDTETKEMNTILISGEKPGNSLPLLERITYVHEFVHALQDQHFGLDDLIESVDDMHADRQLSIVSVFEGDATFVMNQYAIKEAEENPLGSLVSILAGGMEAGNLTMPPGIPHIIEAELLFPYLSGGEFIQTIYIDGGWDAVNAIYDNPPLSTEQILHPEKYLAGEAPVDVTIDIQMADDWTLLREDTMGEFHLREYLDTLLDKETAQTAAAGWNGGRYQIYGNDSSQQAWILRLAFDSNTDSDEFIATYDRFMQERAGGFDDGCAIIPDETFCMGQSDTIVTITYAPDIKLAQQLLDN